MILRVRFPCITANIARELKLVRIGKIFNCRYKVRGVPLGSRTRLATTRLRTKPDRRFARSVRRYIRPERVIVGKKRLRVTPRKKILLFLLGFAIEIEYRVAVGSVTGREFRIFKIEPAIGRNLFAFGLLLFKGKKRLELLEVAKGGKVNRSILGRKTGGWLPILKKQLELLDTSNFRLVYHRVPSSILSSGVKLRQPSKRGTSLSLSKLVASVLPSGILSLFQLLWITEIATIGVGPGMIRDPAKTLLLTLLLDQLMVTYSPSLVDFRASKAKQLANSGLETLPVRNLKINVLGQMKQLPFQKLIGSLIRLHILMLLSSMLRFVTRLCTEFMLIMAAPLTSCSGTPL